MKVKAAVLRQVGQPAPYAVSQPLVIETVELAPPGTGEICVRVLAAGLCHSDLSGHQWISSPDYAHRAGPRSHG